MIPYVWSDDVLGHDPRQEIWVGVPIPAGETADRAMTIRAALQAAGHAEHPATAHDDSALLQVHEVAMVDWLRTAVHLHKGCYRGQACRGGIPRPRTPGPASGATTP